MSRYNGNKRFKNTHKYYEYLRRKRKLKAVNHYATPILRNPTVKDRMNIISDTHIWTLGDRYYKLANKYYGDPNFWWVIAWYNAMPIEADILTGELIEIPVNLSSILGILNVDY